MKRLAVVLAWALVPALAAAQAIDPRKLPPASSTRWFNLNKTSTGYVAAGKLGDEIWAFHVRGDELRNFPETSSPTFSIDGVVLQVKAVHRGAFASDGHDVLEAHRKYEQEFERKRAEGAIQYTDTRVCAGAKLPHREWVAQSTRGETVSRAYVTFQVGDYVLMVVAPYENELRARTVARAIDEICRSFTREKG